MTALLHIITVGISVLFLTVPLINRNVFKTPDIEGIVVSGREGIERVQQLQRDRKFTESIDSANALIDRYKNDSTMLYTADITNWPLVKEICQGKKDHPYKNLFIGAIDEGELAGLKQEDQLPLLVKNQVITELNFHIDNNNFFANLPNKPEYSNKSGVMLRLNNLKQAGILYGSTGDFTVKEGLDDAEKLQLKVFQRIFIEKVLFPEFIKKDLKRGNDWASEFIVQTAMFNIGVSYKANFELDEAIKVWNQLIEEYPKSIYAEVLFLQIGEALFAKGKDDLASGNISSAEYRFNQAIEYLKKLEMNREIAAEFPKYKYADLEPETYVNVDKASKAKSQVKQKTDIYTSEQAEADLSGKSEDDNSSGYYLEDAIKKIGECYTELGKTDSARMQYQLLLDYFPESDNLDDAQKLIADSYIRDGDMILQEADSTDASAQRKATEQYELAVKSYLKFINVFPQSDLISDVYIALGDAYNKLQRRNDATKAFASALGMAKEAEDQAKVQLQIGNYYFERERYDEAIDAYQIILNNFLSTEVAPNAQYMLAQCYFDKGDTTDAVKAYEVILDIYKTSSFLPNAAYKLGDYYMNKKNYKDARRAFNTGCINAPESNFAARSKHQMGMIWIRTAKETNDPKEKEIAYKAAIKEFENLIKNYGTPDDADRARYQIAVCYKEMNMEEAAKKVAEKVENLEISFDIFTLFGFDDQDLEDQIATLDLKIQEAKGKETKSQIMLKKGSVLSDKMEKYDEALEVYEQAKEMTAKNSKKIKADVNIAKIYGKKNDYDKAAELYNELIENPRVNEGLRQQLSINLYDIYFKAKKYDEAYAGFDNFAASHPTHSSAAYAVYRMGSIYAVQKEYEKAMEKYQTVIDKFANSNMYDKAVLGVGEQMINLGEYRKGLNYLKDFIEDTLSLTSAPSFFMKMAEVYTQHLDNKEEAINLYQKIINNYPDSHLFSYSAYKLGVLYKEMNNDKKAMEIFEMVKVEDKAIFRAAQSEIGRLLAKTDPEKAITYYQNIVDASETPEDSARAMIGIGDVYSAIKKWRNAGDKFGEVYDFYTGDDTTLLAGALVKRVDALVNGKMFSKAIETANIMQKKYPDHPLTINTYYFESTALFQLKRYKSARNVMYKIIELDRNPQLTEIAYYQLGDSYYFGKQLNAAIQKYSEYVKKYPKGTFTARAVYMRATCYLSQQPPNYEKARDGYYKVVTQYPNYDDICMAKYYLAICYDRLDQGKSALKYLNQVIKGGCNKKARELAKKKRDDILVKGIGL